jgi:hypothetical protein
MYNAPLLPAFAVPVVVYTVPLAPLMLEPVPINTEPLEKPLLLVPVDKITTPLAPAAPAFAVCTTAAPLVVAEL